MAISYNLDNDSILEPNNPVQHRDDEYPEGGFAALWGIHVHYVRYRGQHRVLRYAFARHRSVSVVPLSNLDLRE
jgi:hypothetical protein